jgi:hypothetical protein
MGRDGGPQDLVAGVAPAPACRLPVLAPKLVERAVRPAKLDLR